MAANEIISNNRGIAILETLPMLVLFTMILGYAIGLWGVVHTAIHNSMGARAYALSTFNQRTDLTVLRDTSNAPADQQYQTIGFRLHSIFTDEVEYDDSPHYVTRRSISIQDSLQSLESQDPPPPPATTHNENVHAVGLESRIRVNPVWVQTTYGICLNTNCGEN